MSNKGIYVFYKFVNRHYLAILQLTILLINVLKIQFGCPIKIANWLNGLK